MLKNSRKRGIKTLLRVAVPTLAMLLGIAATPAQAYLGADVCSQCHPAQFNDWKVSGHPYKLMKADQAKNRPLPLPEGYAWDDISYVIGGYKWKSRYMDDLGYIITSVIEVDEHGVPTGDVTPGRTQYNNATGTWSDYHPGEVKPYTCGACHTTGWVADDDAETDGDLSDNQDGLPGIYGTFFAGGVQCEACHNEGFAMDVDSSAAFCGTCHVRGATNTIPAKGGFIRHHEQYNEFLASPHNGVLECVSCHDPHKKAELSIHTACADCHTDEADSYAGSNMEAVGVACKDCHMPYATKSAVAANANRGDVRTHLLSINTDVNGEMFTPDGGLVALDGDGQGAVTLNFSCGNCHRNRSDNWIAGKAKNFHQRGSGKGKHKHKHGSDSDSD